MATRPGAEQILPWPRPEHGSLRHFSVLWTVCDSRALMNTLPLLPKSADAGQVAQNSVPWSGVGPLHSFSSSEESTSPSLPSPVSFLKATATALRYPMHSLLLLALLPGLALAGDEARFATDLGAAGTSRANLRSLSAVLTAPSVIPLVSRYDVSAGLRLGPDKGRNFHAGAVDSMTGPVAMGFLLEHQRSNAAPTTGELPGWIEPGEELENPHRGWTVGGAVGGAWLGRSVSLAAGPVYRWRGSNYDDPTHDWNAVASAGAHLADQVILTVSGENLIPTDFADAPLRAGAGLRWQPTDGAGLEADVLTTIEGDVAVGFAVGGEVLVAGKVPVRGGFERDREASIDAVCAGLSFGEEGAMVDYGFRMVVGQEESFRSWHGLTLRMRF